MPSAIFFSSCFTDPAGTRLALRDRVNDQLNGSDRRARPNDPENYPVWMAENWPDLHPSFPLPALEKALICVEGVRSSDAYVAVARQNYGSKIEAVPPHEVQVSYFELELFEAALLRKPALVFILEGAEPQGRLLSILKLVAPALPGLDWTPRSEDYIFARLASALENVERGRPIWKSQASASGVRISNQLMGARHVSYDPLTAGPSVQFLGGLADPATATPDGTLVEKVLSRARAEANHHRRLSLIWMAIRELMGAPPTRANDAFVPLWEDALTSWNSAGAWYGLHGHPLMGCLASLSSLTQIRAERSGYADAPHGGLASEYYSIAKHVGRPELRQEAMHMSRQHVDAEFLKGETSGTLGLRASIRYAQGDKGGAIADYRRALDRRLNIESSEAAAIGESENELGFALVRNGQRHDGLRLMEDGVDRLESGPVTGFVVRAKRKLGRAYLIAGAPRRALTELASAHRLAAEHDLLDQIGTIDRLAARAELALPRWVGKNRRLPNIRR